MLPDPLALDNETVEKYLWANLTTLLAVYDSNDNLIQRYNYADHRMPISMTTADNTKYYLHYDQVGSLRAISDTNHNVIKEVAYDTFGNVLTDTNPTFKVPFGFAGGLYDQDTKLTRFGYRDYDAYTGKWTAKDPILGLMVAIVTFMGMCWGILLDLWIQLGKLDGQCHLL